MKVNWLDRRVAAPGPYLCLCLSEAEYKQALKDCGIDPFDSWIKTPQADATAHHARCNKGLVCIVCINIREERPGVEIAGLLVHEAVHAWQEWCEYYGEHRPAQEQEAYAIQSISQELMAEYARRVAK